MINKVIEYKDKISIFRGLSNESIKMIVQDCKMIKYNRGETIIQQGDNTKNVFFLVNGKIKVLINKKEVGQINSNQAFGEFSAIAGEKRNATLVATEPCNVLSFALALDKLEKEFSGFAGLYKNICNELIIKVDEANRRSK